VSEGSRGGWKLVFREDEIETLKEVLDFVIAQQDKRISQGHLEPLDRMSMRVASRRVQELRDYINSVCG